MYWLMDKHSKFSLYNKQILKLYLTTSLRSNSSKTKYYGTSLTLPGTSVTDRYLQIFTISEEIQRFAQKHEDKLHHHTNAEGLQLLDTSEQVK